MEQPVLWGRRIGLQQDFLVTSEDSFWRNSESRSAPEGMPRSFFVEIEAEFLDVAVMKAVPGHSQVLADSVLTGALPGFDVETTFA